VLSQFEAWCNQRWSVLCDWSVLPCAVHVSPACLYQVHAADPNGGGLDFIRLGADYYDELIDKYRTGQVRHTLTEPLRGEWYILLHLGMLYIDDREHPVPTQERRA
jgi:hypothetical protein